MQFIQFFQISDCGYLQEIEVIFADIAKIGDVAEEGGTPVIILADAAMDQQIVPPSECTRAFSGLRTHGTSQSQRKIDDAFRSANLSVVTLFRSCAARCYQPAAGCPSDAACVP
ncbi:hypothetical protein QA649_39560 [Bradyrhizobium sp. CB1717]|uniref:hypothetical protein n=1 Tax=Bradyrhizobium sp. CB1717 TaxID=3039154 RepID=UPI0024B0B1EF|nr:hypothetical protein [Bradyrhizobium sp. CB1717]WFU24036.1 hypothetical protein QA649_39560 [Bradyrhizobium sp. CB1717]